MPFTFQKRKKVGKKTTANISKSGVSLSKKAGPVTLNTRGRGSVRIGKGVGFKFKI